MDTINFTFQAPFCQLNFGVLERRAKYMKQHSIRFVAFITRDGKRLYARDFGKKAWPIRVRE
ncbi:MAG: hypothetical protein HY893_01375 [Deltaproteobacteria bacterium]|nr:hypothetical protein [Deltaproteobacteria bacterium]